MASRHTYSSDELRAALNALTRIGVLMLQSGAASFRTRDTMDRLALALGLDDYTSFVIPTKVIGIVQGKDGSFTRAMRVRGLSINMARISAIHVLSHHPDPGLTPAQLAQKIATIESSAPNYPTWIIVIMVALACASFAAILGGGPLETLAAFIGAAMAQVVRGRMIAARFNPYVITAVSAAIASTISYVVMYFTGAPQPRIGLIASVLLLVPGVLLVTSLLDLLHLDIISGVARGVYAALILINIGIGMLVALVLTGFSLI